MNERLERRVYDHIGMLGFRFDGFDFDALTEAQRAELREGMVKAVTWDIFRDQKMPCGHRYADLIGAPGTITKCGGCLAERQAARAAATYKGELLPVLLDGTETPEVVGEKMIGDAVGDPERAARATIAYAVSADRAARQERRFAAETRDGPWATVSKALDLLNEERKEAAQLRARIAELEAAARGRAGGG